MEHELLILKDFRPEFYIWTAIIAVLELFLLLYYFRQKKALKKQTNNIVIIGCALLFVWAMGAIILIHNFKITHCRTILIILLVCIVWAVLATKQRPHSQNHCCSK